MFSKETKTSHICSAQNKIVAKWIETYQTKLLDLVLIHTNTASTCIHLVWAMRTNQVIVSYKYFFAVTMEKIIFYIYLINRPLLWSSNDNNSLHRSNVCYGCKSLVLVHPILLCVTKNNRSIFVPIKSFIRMKIIE